MTDAAVASHTVLSKADYARHRGCHASYISRLIATGRLESALTTDGGVIREVADRILGQKTSRIPPGGITVPAIGDLRPAAAFLGDDAGPVAVRAGDAGGAEGGAYADARARREAANATRAEMELAELQGRLIDKGAALSLIEARVGRLRDRMLLLPRDLTDRLVHMTNPAEIRQELTTAIDAALLEASEDDGGDDDADD